MGVARICRHAGCDDLAIDGQTRCEEHAPVRAAEQAARRQGAKRASAPWQHLYQSRFWKNGRDAHIDANPLCVMCLADGLVVAAREVDHVVPHRGCVKLFRDRGNWQSLCRRCHSRKTAGEVLHGRVGGVGKAVVPPV
jgi:5-methylcytosine-specific restriction enzyme A